MENLIKNRMKMDSIHLSGSSDLESNRENFDWITSVYLEKKLEKIKFNNK